MAYVSRAWQKLEHALLTFAINPTGLTCADFGSSTGGFVDCLLQHRATKVYAVETGYGVLDWKLRNDPRVVVMERTNAMHVKLPELVDLITIDTSWTKLERVIPNAVANLKAGGKIIALVKPHYETGAQALRNGSLPDEEIEPTLEKVKTKLSELGLMVEGQTESPIIGAKGGNREFLFLLNSGILGA
ncbi:MAG TPA: SAM-dependent methyltransferase [Candidatus Paceibacterota bacterium]